MSYIYVVYISLSSALLNDVYQENVLSKTLVFIKGLDKI